MITWGLGGVELTEQVTLRKHTVRCRSAKLLVKSTTGIQGHMAVSRVLLASNLLRSWSY
jgi:hypothetical protein